MHSAGKLSHEVEPYTASQGRSFGITVGVAFGVLAAVLYWRSANAIAIRTLGAIAVLLLAAALLIPGRLGPVESAWMGFARVLSRVTTPIFMGIVYFVVLTPVALFRRAIGRNALTRRDDATTYWIPRASKADPVARRKRMERQF
ncbi:MAG TPA: SxtJ family membrane protein [Gemmatimonadaceae bacterium]|nr:SxtJ family membrane protein [Gemmatimonadaceae bacterium]